VFVEGRAANGMTYGATFEFQMDNSQGTAADNSNVSMDELWGYISFPNLGTIRFGQEDSAASLLVVRAPTAGLIASDGDWYDFMANPGLYGAAYMLSGINDGNDATKVVYLSPQFAGFDFGVSYAPNGGEGERHDLANGQMQRDQTTLQNELSAAIRYRGTFGPVGVNAGFGAMRADSQRLAANGTSLGNLRPQDVTAYTVGLNLSAYGFAIGGEYTWGAYNGTSVGRTALNPGLDDSHHFIIGASYTMGPLMIGGNYGRGKQSNGTDAAGVGLPDREHTAWGIGAVYNLAPGLGLVQRQQHPHDQHRHGGRPPRLLILRKRSLRGAAGETLPPFVFSVPYFQGYKAVP
jgi:predicted porin